MKMKNVAIAKIGEASTNTENPRPYLYASPGRPTRDSVLVTETKNDAPTAHQGSFLPPSMYDSVSFLPRPKPIPRQITMPRYTSSTT